MLGILVCAWALFTAHGVAEEPRTPDFARDIQPLLAARCLKCHGPEKQLGGLRLDEREAALAGGDSGAVIVPGKSAASHLIERVASADDSVRMPPEMAEPLSAAQVDLLKSWIDAGASWPASEAATPQAHWSLQPLTKPALPPASSDLPSPIDRFITARLAQDKLTLSAAADRRTLIRRVYFDLIGLPPTPEEVAAFVADPDPQAYEKLVERLLVSPHHGERWAQHWLDAVRFAESDGFETNKPRANAWHYRDYVMDAMNADKPYDQFVIEQLAGDAVGTDAATGFLVGGANDVVTSPDPVLTAQQRADVLHDMVSTTASTFLGLTVGCARCHNHKFDPIPQVDYYAMKAAFAGVSHGERPLLTGNEKERERELQALEKRLAEIDARLLRWEPLATVAPLSGSSDGANAPAIRRAVHPRLNVDRFAPVVARRLRFTVHKTSNLEPCIDELEVYTDEDRPRNMALAGMGTKATASSVYPNSAIHRLEHVNDGQVGNGRSWISSEMGRGWIELEFLRPVTISTVRWGRDRQERFADRLPVEYTIEVASGEDDWQVVATAADRQPYAAGKKYAPAIDATKLDEAERKVVESLLEERTSVEARYKELSVRPMLYAGVFNPSPPMTNRLHRGDPMQPRDEVPPGGLQVVAVAYSLEQAAAHGTALTEDQRRRLALAQWIVDRNNPLTARVIVNRLWQHHFGEGLVGTPSDFGANGSRPTHPELLDWLAAELVEHGWSLRHLHRLMVNSATYRQASAAQADGVAIDAQSRLLWRYPPRRLEAEQLRDSMLAISGKLDLRQGGAGFLPFEPNDNYVRVYNAKKTFGPEDWRRMIYMTKIRMQQEATFGAFDCPDGGQIAPRRSQSTTPLQALNLLNSPFVMQQSELFAKRLEREAGPSVEAQVSRAYQLVLQREPAGEELTASVRVAEEHGLAIVCRALFNSNEFLFVH